jgi:hypothetical protein
LIFKDYKIVVDDIENIGNKDLLILINKNADVSKISELVQKGISVLNYKEKRIILANKNIIWNDFIAYIRRYGIRLYID